MTPGEGRLVDYVSSLVVTQGQGRGERFPVLPWQRRFLRGAFAPGLSGDAALSVARGAGKSTLMAAVAAACVDGPLHEPRAEVVIVAASLDQARISFDHAAAFLLGRGHNLEDKRLWRYQSNQTAAHIRHIPSGVKLMARGHDPERLHGLAPILVLADEPREWPPSTSAAAYEALSTAMGKIPGSRLVALGNQSPDTEHWFSRLLSGGASYAQLHAARPDDPPFAARTWRRACPSLAVMPSLLERVRTEAAAAKADPQLMSSFRARRLNLPAEGGSEWALLDAQVWAELHRDVDRDGPFVLGVDLGGTAAMSAAAAYWPSSGRLEAVACIGGVPSLDERGKRDSVGDRYRQLEREGSLVVAAGSRVPDPIELLLVAVERWGPPSHIAADRYREGELHDALERSGVPVCELELRGQGYRDGGEDVRAFRTACLSGVVAPARSLLLSSAMREARVAVDESGNTKLSKGSEGGRRSRARDDAAAAAVVAVAAGERLKRDGPLEGGVRVRVVAA